MIDDYELSGKLAGDLAESYIADNLVEMMVVDSKEKAKAVRKQSEENKNQCDAGVQEYRTYERIIHRSLYKLMSGYKGYKITKE